MIGLVLSASLFAVFSPLARAAENVEVLAMAGEVRMRGSGGRTNTFDLRALVAPDAIRVEARPRTIPGKPSRSTIIIYDRLKDAVWTLDEAARAYVQMTRQEALEAKSKLDGMRYLLFKKAGAKEASRTLEARATGGEGAALVLAGRSDKTTVGPWRAAHYNQGETPGQVPVLQIDAWFISLADAGVSPPLFGALVPLGRLVGQLLSAGEPFFKFRAEGDHVAPEIAVRFSRSLGGILDVEARVTSIRKERAARSLFEAPYGYTRRQPTWR